MRKKTIFLVVCIGCGPVTVIFLNFTQFGANIKNYVKLTNLGNFGCQQWNCQNNSLKNKSYVRPITELRNENQEQVSEGIVVDKRNQWTCINQDICVYSSYWDDRPCLKPQVRSIAVSLNSDHYIGHGKPYLALSCFVRVNGKAFQGLFSFRRMTDRGGKKSLLHSATMFSCEWEGPFPTHISFKVVPKTFKTKTFLHWFPVKKMEFSSSGDIAVCVRPFFGHRKTIELAAFIAFYDLMGVKHFSFYDYHTEFDVKVYLQRLKKRGYSVELISWNAPPTVLKTWEMAQAGFIHDCIFRNARQYTYVLVIDTDEYIVPKTHRTLPKLVKFLKNEATNVGAFHFKHAYFCSNCSSVSSPLAFLNAVHHSKIMNPCSRSKYLVMAKAFVEGRIHCVNKMCGKFRMIAVNSALALLHHRCENQKHSGFVDTSILRFVNLIMNSEILRIWNQNRTAINQSQPCDEYLQKQH